MLDVNREEALQILESGKNIFISGAAGSGKSHLIKDFVKNTKRNVALTATTGIAALNIGGETIHRFLGIGIATRNEQADRIIGKWESIKRSVKSWDQTKWSVMGSIDTIVIDEVSMLRRDQFELIEVTLTNIMENFNPFGGVQIILVGDFFQLPPVVTNSDKLRYADLKEPFCFQSELWHHAKFHSINLTSNYRQSDPIFSDTLNNIRIGNVDDKINEVMLSCVGKDIGFDMESVKLFPFKKDVAQENLNRLKLIEEDKYVSDAEYSGKKFDIDVLKKDCPAEDSLMFCKGAQVMMLTNDYNKKWVNGSIGKIVEADPITIKLANGLIIQPPLHKWERAVRKPGKKYSTSIVSSMTQYPFKLSYSASIHKSQGLTLDLVDLDLSSCFVPGQAYVALSRVRKLNGLKLKGWDPDMVKSAPEVNRFYKLGTI